MDDAFARAALYAACEKSPILKQIKIEDLQVSELRELVNINSSFQTRYLPILVSKFIIKTALQLGVNTFKNDYPVLCEYIKPENIKITVESDEIACLESSPSSSVFKKHNIIFTVTKNIITGALGLSLDSLEKILNDVGTHVTDSEKQPDNVREKIEIINKKQHHIPIVASISSPKHFSNSFSNTFNDKSNTLNNPSVVKSLPSVSVVQQKTNSTTKRKSDSISIGSDDDDDDDVVVKRLKETTTDRIHEYVENTLSYTNKEYDLENPKNDDDGVPDNDDGSVVSISPSHSASQCHNTESIIDYTNLLDKTIDNNVNATDARENDEDFFLDDTDDVDHHLNVTDNNDNNNTVTAIKPIDYDYDDNDDEYDVVSKSSIELVPSRLKKNTNVDKFINSTEAFLSRVSNNDAELSFDFD
ncbi:protein ecdysoneless homolog [Rhopalosiphum maidis]|uniref:protein ecdysoneless homolog n=1 Tax=Rhopalosiphum maidis TaxID=43146 RepID=UPI00101CA490|nr:protein ecdysoneless homolog [Rhopalosiphum maidis]